MLYVRHNKQKDMFFVCSDTNEEKPYEIVKIFYSHDAAIAYVQMVEINLDYDKGQ